jgi:hypothetical protein
MWDFLKVVPDSKKYNYKKKTTNFVAFFYDVAKLFL